MLSGAGTDSDSFGGDVFFFSQRPGTSTIEKEKVGSMQSTQYVQINDKEAWEKTLNYGGKMHSKTFQNLI